MIPGRARGEVADDPVAVGGLIFFAFTTLLTGAGFAAPAAVREHVPGYLFAASTIGLAVVLYLGYASFVLLKLVCVLCVITYAAVVGLFLISGAATSFPMTSLPRRALNDLKLLASSCCRPTTSSGSRCPRWSTRPRSTSPPTTWSSWR